MTGAVKDSKRPQIKQNSMETENNQENQDLKRVREACEALGEHFDTVQIFTTRHESGEFGGTVNVRYGVGNWFARKGQIEDGRVKEDETTRHGVRVDGEGDEE